MAVVVQSAIGCRLCCLIQFSYICECFWNKQAKGEVNYFFIFNNNVSFITIAMLPF